MLEKRTPLKFSKNWRQRTEVSVSCLTCCDTENSLFCSTSQAGRGVTARKDFTQQEAHWGWWQNTQVWYAAILVQSVSSSETLMLFLENSGVGTAWTNVQQ